MNSSCIKYYLIHIFLFITVNTRMHKFNFVKNIRFVILVKWSSKGFCNVLYNAKGFYAVKFNAYILMIEFRNLQTEITVAVTRPDHLIVHVFSDNDAFVSNACKI